ncbi:MAG: hypothetical protein K2Q01_01180, partial [Rickettsiales bacterium]|nr:hypothetical protein [Rickettsiales bacterium]
GTFCSLSLQRKVSILNSLWNYENLTRGPEEFVSDFRLFDCALPTVTMTDMATKSRLGGSGPSRFYISSQPSGPTQHIRVYLHAPDVEATAEGDEMLDQFMRTLEPNLAHTPRRMSLYGKQLVDIDFYYNGPSNLKEAVNPDIDISLGRLDITNAAYAMHFALYFNKMTTPEGKTVGKVTVRGESTFTGQYDILIREVVRAIIDEAYTSPDPRFMEFQASMPQQYTAEQFYAIVAPAIPHFAALGKVVQSLDVEYSGDTQFANGEAILHDLELSATPYGVSGNGVVKREKAGAPQGHAALTCTNCPQMIDDMLDYATRIQRVIVYFSPAQAAEMQPNPQLAEGVKSFLLELAGPDKTNLSYEIISDPQSGISINGKPLSVVTSKYYQYIAPALKNKKPSPTARPRR